MSGPDIGRLLRDGELATDGGVVRRDEISTARPGQSLAVVMDTRVCGTVRPNSPKPRTF